MVDAARSPTPLQQPTAKVIERTSPTVAKDDDPSIPSAAHQAMEAKRELPRTLMGGTEPMREVKDYTPQLEAEKDEPYKDRVALTFLTPTFKKTVQRLTGKVFAAALELVGVPAAIVTIWENIDRLGQHGDVFVARVCEQSMALGGEAILVDHPPGREDGTRRSAKDDEIESIRPYWVHIRGHEILEAVPVAIGASTRLGEIRLLRNTTVKKGKYGSKVETRVLHYFRGDPRVSEQDPMSKRWARVMSLLKVEKVVSGRKIITWENEGTRIMKPQVEIPIEFVPTGDHGFFFALPPLEDLAQLGLQHWQKKSHYATVVLACARPIPTIPAKPDQIDVSAFGPMEALYTGSPEVQPYWLELKGQSVPVLVQDLERIEAEMAQAGDEPMMRKASGDEKATIRLLDEAKAATSLQRDATKWLDAVTNLLGFTAIWMGLESGGSVMLQKGIYETLRAQQPAAEITKGMLGKALSAHGWQTQMKKRGELSEDHDIEADLQRLESDKASGLEGFGGLDGLEE